MIQMNLFTLYHELLGLGPSNRLTREAFTNILCEDFKSLVILHEKRPLDRSNKFT